MNMIFTLIDIYNQRSFGMTILKWQIHPELKNISIAI